jgi:hypothetical protein
MMPWHYRKPELSLSVKNEKNKLFVFFSNIFELFFRTSSFFCFFCTVIECVPAIVAKTITESLEIPTIGIGAGPHTTGQVLVYHDLLGVPHHAHYDKHVPSFCKQYMKLGKDIHQALLTYKEEVYERKFPDEEKFSPYKMSAEESGKFMELMNFDKTTRATEKKDIDKKLRDMDEYEQVKLYKS